ncbi:hypothetical protein EVAR_22707_1 [Eumeta japonica]|uniref:Uncharacterized protein n=1 Tax=Eumeta variegata TaxID=151549 RepID=A0A4C1USA7_EUMVA|nr:hypothetical protein EVAR_22707_1 [Eumeta japonica]
MGSNCILIKTAINVGGNAKGKVYNTQQRRDIAATYRRAAEQHNRRCPYDVYRTGPNLTGYKSRRTIVVFPAAFDIARLCPMNTRAVTRRKCLEWMRHLGRRLMKSYSTEPVKFTGYSKESGREEKDVSHWEAPRVAQQISYSPPNL